jgi:hypothetical protein
MMAYMEDIINAYKILVGKPEWRQATRRNSQPCTLSCPGWKELSFEQTECIPQLLPLCM